MRISLDCRDGQHIACEACGGCGCGCHRSLVDAIATSAALYDYATELRAEAWLWSHPACRVALLRDAVQCEEAARQALFTLDPDVAEAIAIAADVQLTKARTLRRFLMEAFA